MEEGKDIDTTTPEEPLSSSVGAADVPAADEGNGDIEGGASSTGGAGGGPSSGREYLKCSVCKKRLGRKGECAESLLLPLCYLSDPMIVLGRSRVIVQLI